ncbi:MAG TPA: hypothetical protein VHQ45_19680, partial [Gemmatimonadaceae bacterium]|nr:hypothetical protein [Gemmatimonadaceae bacterium]
MKKRAAEFEQKKQFDKALVVYAELLGPTERIDDLDIALFNKVGDLYLRQGQVSEALRSYERGVDLYAERGFFTNAIALCNKILRQGVSRPDVLLRLGKIKIRTGFRSDAQQHFEEYVGHMRLNGAADVAFANLRSFADSEPDNEDLQVVVADLMARGKQTESAVALLDAFRARAQERGQTELVRSVVKRIRAIDPEYAPPTDPDERRDEQGNVVDGTRSAAAPASGMSGLVFFEPEGHERTDTRPRVSRPTPIAPPAVRPSSPTPIYTTSIPGFSITPADGLVLDFMPQALEGEPTNPDYAQPASPLAVPDEPLAAELLALEPLVTEPPVTEPDVGNANVDAVLTLESMAPKSAGEDLTMDPVMAGSETFEPILLEPLVFEPMNLSPGAPLESEPVELVPVMEDAATDEESIAAIADPLTDAIAGSIAFAASATDEWGGDERAGHEDSPAVHADGGTPAADADAAFFVPDAVSLEDSVAADGTPASAAADAETAVAWIQPGSTDSLDFSAEFSSGLPELADDQADSGFGDTSFAPGDPFEPQDIEAAFAPDALVSVPPAADAEPVQSAPEHAVAVDAGMDQAGVSPIEVEAEQAPVAAVVEPAGADVRSVAEAAMDDELPDRAPDVSPDLASDASAASSTMSRGLTLADAQAYAGVGDRESAIRVLRDLLRLHEEQARYTDAAAVVDELARLDAD